jgi:TrmH family RNA methyltransferase
VASPELTDPQAPRVRDARRLARRAFRGEQRRFLVEGVQAVREALAGSASGDVVVRDLFVTLDAAQRHPELLEAASAQRVPVRTASDSVLAALSETVTPQGLVAVCAFLDRPLDAVTEAGPRLVALLAEVRDPGNAGSVLRAADAAGADAVVFSTGSVDPYNGKVVRASVGGLFHVPVVTGVPTLEAVTRLRAAGLQVLAAAGAAAEDLDHAAATGLLARPTAWLFGNEAWGLPPELLDVADTALRIPIYGRAESLNLATAAALCLYASARAHRSGGSGA